MANQTPAVGMERKLAAIFSTDVAGYNRLMGEDEEATIGTLTAHRAVISSLIHHHRGRVVDAPGANLLAEFASVVDAVRCAVEIQHALKEKNAELPPHRQMQFRIGINLGDVILLVVPIKISHSRYDSTLVPYVNSRNRRRNCRRRVGREPRGSFPPSERSGPLSQHCAQA
jgi:class 3 adenylate cyclase